MDDREQPNPKGEVKSKPPEFLDFEIDKTYEAFTEAGKSLNTSFLTYFLLLGFTGLLSFGSVADENVTLPLLEVAVRQSYASVLALLLSSGILLWFFSTVYIYGLLTHKLFDLIEERYGIRPRNNWYIGHVSFFWTLFTITTTVKLLRFQAVMGIVTAVFITVSLTAPIFLAWRIYRSLQSAILWQITWLSLLALILTSSVGILIAFLRALNVERRRQIIDELETPLRDV